MSSFQLELCKEFNPEIAVLLNLTPDHLDRHETMENYGEQKFKMFKNQSIRQTIIFPENELSIQPWVNKARSKKRSYSLEEPLLKYWVNVRGKHALLNASAAINVASFSSML